VDLVIGSSSQLAQYFPDDYVKISSRNIDFNYLKQNQWDSVYITFAEQRIYEKNIDYITPNYLNTLKIIKALLQNSKKIVCYTSCELWRGFGEGVISLDTEPNFDLKNEYAISKLLLLNKIKELRELNDLYKKVIFIHPFYFNSTYRSKYFLFGKIFRSIVNNEKISVGNLDFERDMVHTKFVVSKSIGQIEDCMVGAGMAFNVRNFVQDLYEMNGLEYHDLVNEDTSTPPTNTKWITPSVNWEYTYWDLLNDTQEDIEQFKTRKQ
jgi:GDP-D-mannose dehydratase